MRRVRGPKGGHWVEFNCPNCGKLVRRKHANARLTRQLSCSQRCRGILLRTNPDNYLVLDRQDRPTQQLHRAIMEEHLGRKLSPKEIVHHKDENKRNNKLRNLQVMTRGEHNRLHARGASWDVKKALRLRAKGWGFKRIAAEVGISTMGVYYFFQRHNL